MLICWLGSDPRSKYQWKESWGEQMSKTVTPQIYALNFADGACTKLVQDPALTGCSLGHPVWSVDDKSVVFAGWNSGRKLGFIFCTNRASSLYSVGIGNPAEATTLWEHDEFNASSPSFSPDGTTLIWLSHQVGGPHMTGTRVLTSVWNGSAANITAEVAVDVSDDEEQPGLVVLRLPNQCWISTTAIVVSTFHGSNTVPVVVDVADKTLKYMAQDALEGNGTYGSWTVLCATCISSTDGVNGGPMVVAVLSSPNVAPTLMVGVEINTGNIETPGIAVEWLPISTPQQFPDVMFNVLSFEADPVRFEAILMEPVRNENAKKVPLLVVPHGGPHSNSRVQYVASLNAFTALGFAVLQVNYRGSLGFGEKGINSLPGNAGTNDVGDIHQAIQHVIELGNVDPDQICVHGGSHGGFLTAHLTSQYPDLFKAAALRNPVINIPTMSMVTDIPDWCFLEAGINFPSNTTHFTLTAEIYQKMAACSPITRVNDVKTPSLLCIGGSDRRVPPPQGFEWFNALRANNVPTRVQHYPDEHHSLNGVECTYLLCTNTLVVILETTHILPCRRLALALPRLY